MVSSTHPIRQFNRADVNAVVEYCRKDFRQICSEFVKSKDAPKCVNISTAWAGYVVEQLPSEFKQMGFFAKDVKNFMSALEIPEKSTKVYEVAVALFQGEKGSSFSKVIKEGLGLANAMCDSLSLSSRFVPIDTDRVSFANHAFTAIGAGIGVIDDVQNIANCRETDKTVLYVMNFLRDSSFFVLGVVGLSGFLLFGSASVSLILLTCATSGLLFSVGGFFYERIVDPEQKHGDWQKIRGIMGVRLSDQRTML